MVVDLETLKWIIAAIISPATLAIFLWLTQKYWPARQEHSDKTEDATRLFDEKIQDSTLQLVLEVLRQLIAHLIENNNGHLHALTKEVRVGLSTQDTTLKEAVSSINKLLVMLSRHQARQNSGETEEKMDLMEATIRSISDKKADLVVEDNE